MIKPDPNVPHNMAGKDLIRASDFAFIMVLGKGEETLYSIDDFG